MSPRPKRLRARQGSKTARVYLAERPTPPRPTYGWCVRRVYADKYAVDEAWLPNGSPPDGEWIFSHKTDLGQKMTRGEAVLRACALAGCPKAQARLNLEDM